MRPRFLCSTRRRWLLRDATATAQTLDQMLTLARIAMAVGDGEKATRFAGSALECADLLLLTHGDTCVRSIEALRQSAELLADACTLSDSRSPA